MGIKEGKEGVERSIFSDVKNVELDGIIYDIFSPECDPGIFIVINNEGQQIARFTAEELEENGFMPINQMREETHNRLDDCCRGRLFVP
ncbi:hypothetical protein C0416_03765 [bacterium]|nr:hypothetical protein [bacterium]